MSLTELYCFYFNEFPLRVVFRGNDRSWFLNYSVLEKGVRCQVRERVKCVTCIYIYTEVVLKIIHNCMGTKPIKTDAHSNIQSLLSSKV